MKKTFFSWLLICAAIMLFNCNLYAQQADTDFTYKYHSLINSNQPGINFRKSFVESSGFTEISTKAVRHFIKTYINAEDVHWYEAGDGVVAYFIADSIKTRAAYDKKGHWLYSIRSYGESFLPKDVREKIKCTFYDFTISWVNEITTDLHLVYSVQIEDESSWKIIQVYDDEITVVKEFVKATKNAR